MASFSFTNPSSGSAYFFMETVTTSSFYSAGSPTNAIGTYSAFTGSSGLVTSSYIFGVVVPPGSSSFVFTPTSSIATGSVWFRGTGEITATITV
jgi:hypothetical protein